eukprot:SAG31_NODE_12878_length_909_cov_1.733333_1_plen_126_part_10
MGLPAHSRSGGARAAPADAAGTGRSRAADDAAQHVVDGEVRSAHVTTEADRRRAVREALTLLLLEVTGEFIEAIALSVMASPRLAATGPKRDRDVREDRRRRSKKADKRQKKKRRKRKRHRDSRSS